MDTSKTQLAVGPIKTNDENSQSKDVREALITFVDFIYAIVFAAVVEKAYDEILAKETLSLASKLTRLLPIGAIFYFLAWDWITGRILTIRNPYKTYTRFFIELAIAACAYGTAASAISGSLDTIRFFAWLLFFGGLWARKTDSQLAEERDKRELCITQSLQFTASGVLSLIYITLFIFGPINSPRTLGVLAPVAIWTFIFVCEVLVPRQNGIDGGPGVPLVRRRYVKAIRRLLLTKPLYIKHLSNAQVS